MRSRAHGLPIGVMVFAMDRWDHFWIDLAKVYASQSKDPSTKVGAIIAKGKDLISAGYNGFPAGIGDDHRLNDRELKYKLVVHAELNAVIRAGKDARGATLYSWPFPPCVHCMGAILSAGIARIVAPHNIPDRWKPDFLFASDMAREAGVSIQWTQWSEK